MNISAAQHTVTAFDAEILDLREMVLEMGEKSTRAITRAIDALEHNDLALAISVVADDQEIDELERRIDALSIQTIALRAPMADDLRHLIATFKISSIAERIGDYAKNIAKRVPLVAESSRKIEPAALLPSMANIAAELVRDSFKAYADGDVDLAVSVWARDQTLDNFYTSIFRAIITYMVENPAYITESAHLLFIAKNLERIGDHATNIAELSYFAETGRQMPDRTKGNDVGTIWADQQE
ncbi:phosphate signaling complex protein PhoU [Parasphingorhabdus sp.]|jgi:phosphate transport system protein|uniref:phosphate signaling complex protein PhoU n=1 Tax=Parasphingorhabdus sp. TaxID=2709688 RepID=UPI0030A46DA8|nr:phosphate signaling complex protein PhoU [Sphingomonadales bacterium]